MASINRSIPVRTHEGGIACRTDAYTQLRRTVLACMLWEDTFYESGVSVADRIEALVKQCKPYEVAELAVEARGAFKLRHVPLLLARGLAGVGNTGSMVSQTLHDIIQRPDELTEFLALYWQNGKRPLAAQVKKGLAKAFRKLSAYQLAKYNRDGAIKLRDVLFMVHAKPKDDAQAAVWKQLVEGTLPAPDTWEVELSAGKDKKATFERLIMEGKLGYMALLRNLRNMSEAGVDKGMVERAVIDGAANSKALPFRFVAAARAVPQWESMLDKGMQAAMATMPKLPGRTVLLVDVSGSMCSTLSSKSDMKRGDAAGALGALLRGICEEIRVFTFSIKLKEVPARTGMGLIDLLRPRNEGTALGDCLQALNAQYDRIIVITDEQTRGHTPPPAPGTKGYMINVASYQNGVGYGQWTKIDGFSEAVIGFIQELEASQDAEV